MKRQFRGIGTLFMPIKSVVMNNSVGKKACPPYVNFMEVA